MEASSKTMKKSLMRLKNLVLMKILNSKRASTRKLKDASGASKLMGSDYKLD
jgi:hypothetical protein